MYNISGSITSDGELLVPVNENSNQMSFDWYITDATDEVINTPTGISLSFYRRLINSVRKDETSTITSESWEDFASNPFDAQATSIPDTYLTSDKIKCVVSGMDPSYTFNLNIHQPN